MGTVTISASFGAHGDQVGHAVAEVLGLPFLDRAIPSAVARHLNLSEESAEALDERAPSRWERFVTAFAEIGPSLGSTVAPSEFLESPESYRIATEQVLRGVSETTGAVILGRAGMVVLKDRADVLRVRLDGPREARIAQSIADGGDKNVVPQLQKDIDGTREAYASFFYNVHQDDMHLYHLVIDATALPVATCVEIVATAAKARFERATGASL